VTLQCVRRRTSLTFAVWSMSPRRVQRAPRIAPGCLLGRSVGYALRCTGMYECRGAHVAARDGGGRPRRRPTWMWGGRATHGAVAGNKRSRVTHGAVGSGRDALACAYCSSPGFLISAISPSSSHSLSRPAACTATFCASTHLVSPSQMAAKGSPRRKASSAQASSTFRERK
jgi:hypothetical protein